MGYGEGGIGLSRDFQDHHCIVIYPQDQWKDDFKRKLGGDVKSGFLQLGGHADCETCRTCPICQAIEELFDPRAPGEYDTVCTLCGRVYDVLSRRLGQTDGLILFSHYRRIECDLVDALFREPRVKKVFVLNLATPFPERWDAGALERLDTRAIGNSDYGDHENDENVILEVRRDEYMK